MVTHTYKRFLRDSIVPERSNRDRHIVTGEAIGSARCDILYSAPQTSLLYQQSKRAVRSNHDQEKGLRLRFSRGQAVDRRVAPAYWPGLRYYAADFLDPAPNELCPGRARSRPRRGWPEHVIAGREI